MQNSDLEIALQACGSEASSYLARKYRGGNAGGAGTRYETWYAVYKIASLVKKANAGSLTPSLITQAPDFVDDFVIQWHEKSCYEHFQLKNTGNVSWSSGKHPVENDFLLQEKLNRFKKINKTSIALVLPCEDRARKLKSTIPEKIASFSTVDTFAFGETLNQTIQAEPRLFAALADLCVNTDYDKIERLGSLIVGAWVSKSGKACSLNELWEAVLQHEPNYIKAPVYVEILEEFARTLMQIDGFSYTIENGYFDWSYKHYDSGMLEYPVISRKFLAFQQAIITEAPSTFEDLERHLT